ncbi:rust resistance kinase Lr10-like protein [Cinnamomum micranthum f. kanehirae]|uniref:Rust resistance kinase Lr10-like protein n=1 Tax=Cinnamomum micranthum f. kanehirae TaxID=337451 RepID=A0A443NYW1_9MAGN|nr:rust resistance kinase Lr10-like protein [Cinnamomum micranthum f. kanehirae]
MEVLGRRMNIDAFAECSTHFKVEDLVMEDVADNEKEITKKLMIIALWCIQMMHVDRPSMSKVTT